MAQEGSWLMLMPIKLLSLVTETGLCFQARAAGPCAMRDGPCCTSNCEQREKFGLQQGLLPVASPGCSARSDI